MHKILIVSKQSLGDIILQMGVIQALKEKHPTSRISVACDERYISALKKHPDIADVLPLKIHDGKAAGFFKILGQIRRHSFDVILTFGSDKQALWWGFLARIKVRVGTRNQPHGFLLTRSLREHHRELNSFEYYHKLAQLVSPGLAVEYPVISIDKQETQRLRADLYKQRLGRKFIVWHIGSSKEVKRYPVFQIIETLRLFRKKRILLPVLFAGGYGDDKFIAELEEAVNTGDIRTAKVYFADGIEFGATAALFSLAHLVIANDAAPRHVAAAIGKKSLSLMPRHRKHSWQVYGEKQNAYFLFSEVPSESLAVDTIEPVELAGMIRKLI
ncbi:MAG: glycosyltransferase family 9 protein [Spirochaetes bacterium]|nr:glycosyltransferase family 9 protein [Spirochaetota bacterium]MBX3721772.1 glycosyltransferase family 9 protein [Turneriella sp.]